MSYIIPPDIEPVEKSNYLDEYWMANYYEPLLDYNAMEPPMCNLSNVNHEKLEIERTSAKLLRNCLNPCKPELSTVKVPYSSELILDSVPKPEPYLLHFEAQPEPTQECFELPKEKLKVPKSAFKLLKRHMTHPGLEKLEIPLQNDIIITTSNEKTEKTDIDIDNDIDMGNHENTSNNIQINSLRSLSEKSTSTIDPPSPNTEIRFVDDNEPLPILHEPETDHFTIAPEFNQRTEEPIPTDFLELPNETLENHASLTLPLPECSKKVEFELPEFNERNFDEPILENMKWKPLKVDDQPWNEEIESIGLPSVDRPKLDALPVKQTESIPESFTDYQHSLFSFNYETSENTTATETADLEQSIMNFIQDDDIKDAEMADITDIPGILGFSRFFGGNQNEIVPKDKEFQEKMDLKGKYLIINEDTLDSEVQKALENSNATIIYFNIPGIPVNFYLSEETCGQFTDPTRLIQTDLEGNSLILSEIRPCLSQKVFLIIVIDRINQFGAIQKFSDMVNGIPNIKLVICQNTIQAKLKVVESLALKLSTTHSDLDVNKLVKNNLDIQFLVKYGMNPIVAAKALQQCMNLFEFLSDPVKYVNSTHISQIRPFISHFSCNMTNASTASTM